MSKRCVGWSIDGISLVLFSNLIECKMRRKNNHTKTHEIKACNGLWEHCIDLKVNGLSINFAQNIVCNLWKVPVLISYWNHTIHIFWNVSTYFVVVLCVCKTKSGILKMQWTSSSSFFYFPYRKQMTFNSVWKLHGSWICLILTTDFANEL